VVGLSVKVADRKIYVDGVFRSDVDTSLSSRWSGLTELDAFICHVSEGVGEDVHVATDTRRCRTKTVWPNPAIFLTGSAPVVPGLAAEVKSGVIMVQSLTKECLAALDNQTAAASESTFFLEHAGELYRHDSRLALRDNTPAQPSSAVGASVRVSRLNEQHCRLDMAQDSAEVAGLRVQFQQNGRSSINDYFGYGGRYLGEVVLPSVNYTKLPGAFPRKEYVAAQFYGSLHIRTQGKYKFFLSSEDGSRLTLNGKRVITHDGTHGRSEQWAQVDLTPGMHAIAVDYFNVKGGAGVVLKWQGPDSNDVKAVIPSSAFTTESPCHKEEGCQVVCGSPGEIANDPTKGHQMPVRTANNIFDVNLDNAHARAFNAELSKGAVWLAQALHGEDQLRQRTAWALAQIFVVSVQGLGFEDETEMWLAFYDIFMRNAFGNFKDLLREITLNPIMGRYLTSKDSSAFEVDGRYPNENYAREIMQLFSIGLFKMNPDGTAQEEKGVVIPSYSNDHIMSLSRAFTGFTEQPRRGNIEYLRQNLIDPMYIDVRKHDVYPKGKLDGNYLGDGYPLCDQTLPRHAYLAKGARFEFRGKAGVGDALDLRSGSPLYKALCHRSGDGTKCTFRMVVELSDALRCDGKECNSDQVTHVRVEGNDYAFLAPACVHPFVSATASVSYLGEVTVAEHAGHCLDAGGSDVKKLQQRLDKLNTGDTPERRAECLEKCKRAGAYGCELIWRQVKSQGCYAHMSPKPVQGSGRSEIACWVFKRSQDGEALAPSYWMLPYSDRFCPELATVTSVEECKVAGEAVGISSEGSWVGSSTGLPPGCSVNSGTGRLHFNHKWDSTRKSWNKFPICRAHFVIDEDGQFSPDGATKISLQWEGDQPAAGVHVVSADFEAAFDRLPSAGEASARLFIGSHMPADSCSSCDGDVKAFSGDGAFNKDTIFEVDGRFHRNLVSRVRFLGSNKHIFRNPPVFLRMLQDDGAERAAYEEVEAVLDHLVHHANTPAFLGKRLIQRFTTSNPSAWYVKDVADAFRTGTYNGTVFSGQHGDLAATVAAILLHPEARGQQAGGVAAAVGKLREPMLKILHFLRSMEYSNGDDGPAVLRRLHEVVGQFPYEAPTVFSFYLADFELPQMEIPEPEPEPENEPEDGMMTDRRPRALLAPELQIFTPAYFVGFVNGMASLIQDGVSEDCGGEDGRGLGIRTRTVKFGRRRDLCPQGLYGWQQQGGMESTISELDLLLTGGRLSPKAKQVARTMYDKALPSERIRAAQLAIVMSAEFNTLGMPLPLDDPRVAVPPVELEAPRSYKAVVLVFLAGGADTFNLLVPMECDLYKEYVEVRTDLALKERELLKISTPGQTCGSFGVHGSFAYLQSLYKKGEAAFVSNVGNLVEPTTLEAYRKRQVTKCFGLFSHSDQQNGAQTLKCQDLGTSAMGAGGRLADALAAGSQNLATSSFSMAGASIWSKGVTTEREIVDSSGDSAGFNGFEKWRGAIDNITLQRHGNAFSEAYVRNFRKTIHTTENMARLMRGATLQTNYRRASHVERELNQVAKFISTRVDRKAERDFFFVSLGGWDMHSNMKEGLARRFEEIDAALQGFVAEMEAQDIWKDVVLATSSEFGRTLDSNGGGSDHGWAGNHFVIGGSVKGGRVLNKFPASVAAGGPRDLGRGRLIPEYPWESMMAPIGKWVGIEDDQMEHAFPNLKNFDSSHIIADLFQ